MPATDVQNFPSTPSQLLGYLLDLSPVVKFGGGCGASGMSERGFLKWSVPKKIRGTTPTFDKPHLPTAYLNRNIKF